MDKSAALELDFFSMDKRSDGLHCATKPPIFERRRSFRDIQGVISKMNPEVVKSVIAKGGGSQTRPYSSVPSSPNPTNPNFPACDPTLRLSNGFDQKNAETAPMTIFYKGKVAVFDVSPHKAHDILKIADISNPKLTHQSENLLESDLDGDLPITRRNSLQRFLGKRKERLTELSPHYFQA